MAMNNKNRAALRRRRHIRNHLSGTAQRPRLSVFRSSRHIYAQVIDDIAGATLASASTRSKSLRDQIKYGGNIEAAAIVGEAVAKQAIGVGIQCVCFDRNGNKFHCRTKALAEAARKAGLDF